MISRRIITILAGLILAVALLPAVSGGAAEASTAAPAHKVAMMGITSSGQIINMQKPPAWLKPNTLIHPLDFSSPDTLHGNFEICNQNDQCVNNWNGGGQGNLLKYFGYSEAVANNMWNWWFEGTVSSDWPFTASSINGSYSGNPVWKFAAAPNGEGSGNCMSQQLFGPGDPESQVNLTSCACSTCQTNSLSNFQYFVLDGNARLVGVGATDTNAQATGDRFAHVYLGDTGDANGAFVILTTDLDNARKWAAFLS